VAVEELFSGLFNNEVPCKLLNVRSPLAVKFTEITALVSFSTPTGNCAPEPRSVELEANVCVLRK
jgi:hypothetical protein